MVMGSSSSFVPVIDFGLRLKDEKAFSSEVGRALSEVGFFVLRGHGVSQGLIEETYRAAAAVFDLPDDVKREAEPSGLNGQRGYTSFGREHAKDSKYPDLKEFWHVGRESTSLQNIWPRTDPHGFRDLSLRLFLELDSLAMDLLDACSVYLSEEKGYLRSISEGGESLLRVINYPALSEGRDPGSIRAAAHEDINLITLLPTATASGLEILKRDGSWMPVSAGPGEIVVDSGDMLQNLSNGLLRSTTHRVVNPDDGRERRLSMPFFAHPKADADLTPRKASVERTGGKPVYRSITAGEYLAERLREIGLKKK